MLNLTELSEELQEITAWQDTPVALTPSDYNRIVKSAVRTFFRDINRPEECIAESFIEDETGLYYDRDFMIDEVEYILILCRLEFFRRVQMDVNNTVGYSTDALTVTNADKPYANLKNTIDELEHERRICFYKMVRYTFGT